MDVSDLECISISHFIELISKTETRDFGFVAMRGTISSSGASAVLRATATTHLVTKIWT